MSLSCGCDFDPSEHDDYYYHPDDFSEFNEYRRKRCTSCNKLINKGASIAEFKCFRKPKDDIEWRCKGDEIPKASKFLCEHCSEIFFNLNDLGYDCLEIHESMDEYLKEYKEMSDDLAEKYGNK